MLLFQQSGLSACARKQTTSRTHLTSVEAQTPVRSSPLDQVQARHHRITGCPAQHRSMARLEVVVAWGILALFLPLHSTAGDSTATSLTVVIDGYTVDSTITSPATLPLGRTALLVCRVSGIPHGQHTTYQWTCPNQPCLQEEYAGRKINNNIIAINTTSTSDGGTYTCTVTARGMEGRQDFRINIALASGVVVHSSGRLIADGEIITNLDRITPPSANMTATTRGGRLLCSHGEWHWAGISRNHSRIPSNFRKSVYQVMKNEGGVLVVTSMWINNRVTCNLTSNTSGTQVRGRSTPGRASAHTNASLVRLFPNGTDNVGELRAKLKPLKNNTIQLTITTNKNVSTTAIMGCVRFDMGTVIQLGYTAIKLHPANRDTNVILSPRNGFTLVPGAKYNCTIWNVQKTRDRSSHSTMATVNMLKGKPSPPRVLTITRDFEDGIELNWLPPRVTNGDIQRYIIRYTPLNGTEQVINSTDNTNYYNLTGLERGQTYYNFTVKAVNLAHTSAQSDPIGSYSHNPASLNTPTTKSATSTPTTPTITPITVTTVDWISTENSLCNTPMSQVTQSMPQPQDSTTPHHSSLLSTHNTHTTQDPFTTDPIQPTLTARSSARSAPLSVTQSFTATEDGSTIRAVSHALQSSTSVAASHPDPTLSTSLILSRTTPTYKHPTIQPTANNDVVLGGIIGSSILFIVLLVGAVSLCVVYQNKGKRRRWSSTLARNTMPTRTPYYSIRLGGQHSNRSIVENNIAASSHYNRLLRSEEEVHNNSSYQFLSQGDSDYEEVDPEMQRRERTHSDAKASRQELEKSTQRRETETSFSAVTGNPCANGQAKHCENGQSQKHPAMTTPTPPASNLWERVREYTVNKPKTLFPKSVFLTASEGEDDDTESLYTEVNNKPHRREVAMTTPAKLNFNTADENYSRVQDGDSFTRPRDQHMHQLNRSGHRFDAANSCDGTGRKMESCQYISLPLESLHTDGEELVNDSEPLMKDNTLSLIPLPLTPVQHQT